MNSMACQESLERPAPVPENIRDGEATLADFVNGDMPKSGDGSMGPPSALEQVFKHLKSE